jgi:hypothetical protein
MLSNNRKQLEQRIRGGDRLYGSGAADRLSYLTTLKPSSNLMMHKGDIRDRRGRPEAEIGRRGFPAQR